MTFIRTSIKDLGGLIYPRVCFACLSEAAPRQGSLFCVKCMIDIPYTNHFDTKPNDMNIHFIGKVPINHCAALLLFVQGGITQNILHNFKYKGMQDIGKQLGEVAGERMLKSKYFQNIDMIIPVPLHDDKLYIRGFNQSEVFGRGVGDVINVPVNTKVLSRSRFTETQTRKSREERIENVSDAFIISNSNWIKNKHIVLVDDVVTTGSTLESCASLLLINGASKVSILTMAMAIR